MAEKKQYRRKLDKTNFLFDWTYTKECPFFLSPQVYEIQLAKNIS